MSELDDLIKDINKTFGEGSLMSLGGSTTTNIQGFSTGSIKVDKMTGVGGFPRGRISEIFGGESSGKTTMCIHAIADCQAKGHLAAIIDAEHAFDTAYASALGVDINKLLISQPDSGEHGLEIAESLIRSGKVALVIIDSVAALTPKAELEGDMGDSRIGLHARLMSQAMRKLTHVTHKNNVALVMINQTREKIGAYGDPTVTTGGNALKFYASIRIRTASRGNSTNVVDKSGTVIAGIKSVNIVKNKLAPPFQNCEVTMVFGKGIDINEELVDIALELGIITKKGSWYYFQETSLGQGKQSALDFILDNEELIEEIKKGV